MKLHASLCAGIVLCGLSSAVASVPTVENVVLGGGKKAVITYDLTGDPGIVTLDIETNTVADLSGTWLKLDGAALRNVQGEAFCLVRPGTRHRITWRPAETLGAPLKRARAVLTAWSTNAPPDYLVANLAGQDVPRYYPATNYFPFGFGHLAYKTTNIVFKLVKAKGCSFTAGEFGCVDSYGGNNPHVIHMTRDYYLGIYELTQAQYHWATGLGRPYKDKCWSEGMCYDSALPASVGWRGNWRDGKYTEDPGSNSFVGKMRAKTGLYAELPTCAQWEFAMRCGGYRTPDGCQVIEGCVKATNRYQVAQVNQYYGSCLIDVGSLTPNMWGFYDMLGNVTEMCLDWVHCDRSVKTDNNTPDNITEETTDPMGLTEGGTGYRMMGSNWGTSYGYGATGASIYGEGQHAYGTRIAVMLEPPTVAPVVTVSDLDASAVPTATAVTLGQDRANRNLVVTYALNKHAIVTWTLETNAVAGAGEGWITVPETRTNTRIFGDVNRLVEKTGGCSFCWSPDATWDDRTVAEGRARAVLTVWPTNCPPLYMVMDTVGPIVNYYTSTNALPGGGLTNTLYVTRKMVFRKIPAKDVIWTMGVPPDIGDDSYSQWNDTNRTNNTPHKVKLTYDYYVAINELSCAQWWWVMNVQSGYNNISKLEYFSLTNDLPACGCYGSSYRKSANLADTATLVGRLRTYYGDRYPVDILSSAEWEFAYRVGEPNTLFTGKNWQWADIRAAGNVNSYDSYRGTGMEFCSVLDRFPPNRWGLYHMFGNKLDYVRDGSDPLAWTNLTSYIETGIAVDPNDLSDSSLSVRGCCRLEWYQIQEGGYWTRPKADGVNSVSPRLMCPIPKAAE